MQNQINQAHAMFVMFRNRFDEAIRNAESKGIDHTDEQNNFEVANEINNIHQAMEIWKERWETMLEQPHQ